jgi:microcystin-dependent protein
LNKSVQSKIEEKYMSDAFVGEIRMFAGTYAPVNWHFCNGTLLNVADNQALYSLLATTYGGDGVKTFGLPDLRGRLPVGMGNGTGLTPRPLGQTGGSTTAALSLNMVPLHNHQVMASTNTATAITPGTAVILATPAVSTTSMYTKVDPSDPKDKPLDFDTAAIGNSGGGQAHNNVMPSYGMNFIICVTGLYPNRP